jgi:hypothetical protein
MALKKPSVQSFDKVALGLGLTRHAELAQDESKEPDRFQMSVEDESTRAIAPTKPVEDLVQKTSLAGASFAGKNQKALAGLNAIEEFGQS